MTPQRIQQQRTKGWRMPLNAKSVARPSKWGNPYRLGSTQIRMPALDGSEWEHEGRLYKTSGQRHAYQHVEDASAEQVVVLFRAMVTGSQTYSRWYPSPQQIRAELAGFDLACWCPLSSPCHAGVLLELANR